MNNCTECGSWPGHAVYCKRLVWPPASGREATGMVAAAGTLCGPTKNHVLVAQFKGLYHSTYYALCGWRTADDDRLSTNAPDEWLNRMLCRKCQALSPPARE